MTKMTYAMAIDSALMVLDAYFGEDVTMTKPINRDEVRDKLEALKAQLAKRNSGNRKPSKTQVANEQIKADIVSYISKQICGQTASEIAEVFDISNQKASALLTALVNDKALVREVIKGKAYFGIA